MKSLRQFFSKRTFLGSQNGFSLIEIIIVIALIGTLVTIIASRISGASDQANVGLTKTKAQNLVGKLLQYQIDHENKYPTTEQGLQVLLSGEGGVPIAAADDLKDAWGNPFSYKLTPKGPLIISWGKDGQTGSKNAICFLNDKKLDDCNNIDAGAPN